MHLDVTTHINDCNTFVKHDTLILDVLHMDYYETNSTMFSKCRMSWKESYEKFIFVELHHILIHTRKYIFFVIILTMMKKRMFIHFQTMQPQPFNQELFFNNQIHSFISWSLCSTSWNALVSWKVVPFSVDPWQLSSNHEPNSHVPISS